MQTLEDSLKEMSDSNEKLKKENQELKEKVLVLETEVTNIHLANSKFLKLKLKCFLFLPS